MSKNGMRDMTAGSLTGGIHLHTLSCPDEDAFCRVRETLGAMGILWEGEE